MALRLLFVAICAIIVALCEARIVADKSNGRAACLRKASAMYITEENPRLGGVVDAFTYHEGRNDANGCHCVHENCGCCIHMAVPKIHLNDTVCANVTYVRRDIGVLFAISFDNHTFFSEEVSACESGVCTLDTSLGCENVDGTDYCYHTYHANYPYYSNDSHHTYDSYNAHYAYDAHYSNHSDHAYDSDDTDVSNYAHYSDHPYDSHDAHYANHTHYANYSHYAYDPYYADNTNHADDPDHPNNSDHSNDAN
ncbi:Protein C09D4.2 [Aphelenchoides avenae]|nr:Protein C09D4.2 [Aphelenchus avenae]